MKYFEEESYPVTRFALFPRQIAGQWVWLKSFVSDRVLVHSRSDGCSTDIYEYQNHRLI